MSDAAETGDVNGKPSLALSLRSPLALYLAAGLLVLIAVGIAVRRDRSFSSRDPQHVAILDVLCRLDGEGYRRIMRDGYTYSRVDGSTAVWFPGYPLLAWTLYDCGVPARWALVVTSWSALLGAFIAAHYYLRWRFPHDPAAVKLALAALAFNPMAYYMWFAYSEATFLFVLVLLLALMERRAPPVVVALVCGALTGVRSVGVTAVPVVLVYAWLYRSERKWRAVNVAATLLLCGWGLALFAWHLHARFGEPLAFIYAQEPWDGVEHTLSEKVWSLATLGPLRRLADPASGADGIPRHPGLLGLFSNQIGDALSWALFAVLIGLGAWKRWLNWQELLLAVLMFAFCTWFQADRTDMASQGRFMSVIFPAYLVAGRLLAASPLEIRLAVFSVAAGLYVNYAINFATGSAW